MKKLSKIMVLAICALLMLFAFSACKDEAEDAVKPESISITKPTKLNYYDDEELSLTGGSVSITYTDGTQSNYPMSDKANVLISGYNKTPGTVTVTVTCKGLNTTFDIEMTALKAQSLEIKTQPTQKTYVVGDTELNLSGGVIRATLNRNNEVREIPMTDLAASAASFNFEAKGKNKTVVITYLDRQVNFSVDVYESQNAKELGLILQTLPAVDWTSPFTLSTQNRLNAKRALELYESVTDKTFFADDGNKIISTAFAAYYLEAEDMADDIAQHGVVGYTFSDVTSALEKLELARDFIHDLETEVFIDYINVTLSEGMTLWDYAAYLGDMLSPYVLMEAAYEAIFDLYYGIDQIPYGTSGAALDAYSDDIIRVYDIITSVDANDDAAVEAINVYIGIIENWNPEYLEFIYEYYYNLHGDINHADIDALLNISTPVRLNNALENVLWAIRGWNYWYANQTTSYSEFFVFYLPILNIRDGLAEECLPVVVEMYEGIEFFAIGSESATALDITQLLSENFDYLILSIESSYSYTMTQEFSAFLESFYDIIYIPMMFSWGAGLEYEAGIDAELDAKVNQLMLALLDISSKERLIWWNELEDYLYLSMLNSYLNVYCSESEKAAAADVINALGYWISLGSNQNYQTDFLTSMTNATNKVNALSPTERANFTAHFGSVYELLKILQQEASQNWFSKFESAINAINDVYSAISYAANNQDYVDILVSFEVLAPIMEGLLATATENEKFFIYNYPVSSGLTLYERYKYLEVRYDLIMAECETAGLTEFMTKYKTMVHEITYGEMSDNDFMTTMAELIDDFRGLTDAQKLVITNYFWADFAFYYAAEYYAASFDDDADEVDENEFYYELYVALFFYIKIINGNDEVNTDFLEAMANAIALYEGLSSQTKVDNLLGQEYNALKEAYDAMNLPAVA